MRHVFLNQCIQSLKVVSFSTVAIVSTVKATEESCIIINSPFLSPLSKINHHTENKSDKQIENRNEDIKRFSLLGILKFGNNYSFSIHDSVTNQSRWLQGGDSSHEFIILSYDASLNRIDYSWNGTTGSMTITQADGAPIPLAIESRKAPPPEEKTTTAKANVGPKEATSLVKFDKNNNSKILKKIQTKATVSLTSNNYPDRFASTSIYQSYDDKNENNVEIQKEIQRVRRHINKERTAE